MCTCNQKLNIHFKLLMTYNTLILNVFDPRFYQHFVWLMLKFVYFGFYQLV